MERQNNRPPEATDWQAEPRDGPAVLIVHAGMLDEGLGLVGGWVRLDRALPEVSARIGEIIGTGGDIRDYIVIDQLGIGMVMWDQDEVAGLLALARDNGDV